MTHVSKVLSAGSILSNEAVSLTLLEQAGRFSLRVPEASVAAAAKALGQDIPQEIGTRSKSDDMEVLCLGPDEWEIRCSQDACEKIVAAFAKIYAKHPHSLVDISDRGMGIRLSGDKAVDLVTIGCPRDPASIAVGAGRRTVFDGTSVVLWREDENTFRIDAWCSFVPHMLDLLCTGATELALD